MSGETEKNVSAWTIDSLKEHFETRFAETDHRYEQRFNDQDKAVNAAMNSAEKAVTKAEAASERRFEAVNEFRATLADQASHFISRTEALARADANAEKIDALQARLDRIEGNKGGLKDGWSYLVGIVGLASTVIAIVIMLSR